MLAWCLEPPMDPKAPFSVDSTFYSSPGDYYYYGVSFFDEIGYWDPTERFWTSENFPGALALCRRIKAQLLESRLDTPPARAALQKLERRSEEHTSELQSLMRISYAVFCLKKKKTISNEKLRPNKDIKT